LAVAVLPITESAFDARYLAGLFDGEGCVTVSNGPRRPGNIIVKLGLVYETIPHALQRDFGGSITIQNRKPGRKLLYSWNVTGKRAARFLTLVLPWLRIKRQAALLGINHLILELQPRGIGFKGRCVRPEIVAARVALADKLKAANKRGTA
jgi:hypothetical protein